MFKRSRSSKPKFRKPGKQGMSEPRHPGDKSVEVAVTLRAYLDQDAPFASVRPKPGWELNGQVCDHHQDAVVAVAEVLNQFRYGFFGPDGEPGVPEYAEAFSEALDDLMAKHWPEEETS